MTKLFKVKNSLGLGFFGDFFLDCF